MMHALTLKNYIIGAVITAVIMFFAAQFFGPGIAGWLDSVRADSIRAGISAGLVDVVIAPLRFAFTNPVPGAIGGGLLWPLTALWIFFVFILLILGILSAGAATTRRGL
jgi:hypothetical protein